MNRRTFLAVAAGTAATGCVGAASPLGGSDGTPSRTPDGDPDEDPSFPGAACPTFAEEADRTVCYGRRGSADVYLEPSTQRFVEYESGDTVETVTFTLHNGADARFSLNPYDWAIERWTGDGWTRVAPGARPEPLYHVPPGETYEWVVSTEQHPSSRDGDARPVVVDLESGETHAFHVDGRLGDARIECVARFHYVLAVPDG